jgi:hypothetical protein
MLSGVLRSERRICCERFKLTLLGETVRAREGTLNCVPNLHIIKMKSVQFAQIRMGRMIHYQRYAFVMLHEPKVPPSNLLR